MWQPIIGAASTAQPTPADVTTTEHHATADNRLAAAIEILAATPEPGRKMPARTQEQGSTGRRVSALLLTNLTDRRDVDQSAAATAGLKHLLSLGGVYARRRAARRICGPALIRERSLGRQRGRPARRQNRASVLARSLLTVGSMQKS